jgi:hypothetical protein
MNLILLKKKIQIFILFDNKQSLYLNHNLFSIYNVWMQELNSDFIQLLATVFAFLKNKLYFIQLFKK